MLAGLTSRCTSPAAWAASRAEATGEIIEAARAVGSGPSRLTSDRASPPGTYRMAMNSTPSASPASNTGMMCGSSTAAADRDSRMKRCRNASSVARPGARILSATCRLSRSSWARNTTDIPPRPICSSSRYPAICEPGEKPTKNPTARGPSSPIMPPGPVSPLLPSSTVWHSGSGESGRTYLGKRNKRNTNQQSRSRPTLRSHPPGFRHTSRWRPARFPKLARLRQTVPVSIRGSSPTVIRCHRIPR